MNTLVQLRPVRDDSPGCGLLHGNPLEITRGSLGPVARFAPGEVVAYELRHQGRPHLYVFRTLEVDDPLAAAVPGVRPRVRLLVDLGCAGRIRLARSLFSYLLKSRREPSDLPDGFYVRLSVALAGRWPAHTILVSLLSPPPEQVEPCTS
jgi:hypothetical protein